MGWDGKGWGGVGWEGKGWEGREGEGRKEEDLSRNTFRICVAILAMCHQCSVPGSLLGSVGRRETGQFPFISGCLCKLAEVGRGGGGDGLEGVEGGLEFSRPSKNNGANGSM